MLEALGFLALVEVAGLAAAPLAALVFARLPGSGLGFAKPLGLLLVGWLAWMAASVGLADYGRGTLAGALVLVALAGAAAALRQRTLSRRLGERPEPRGRLARWRRARLETLALPAEDPHRRGLLIGSEVVFVVAFAAMALLVSFAPDVWNTEKPMDMGFMSAIAASGSFPPHDPWMAGETINYYYLGHLLLAMPAHALGLEPSVGYNLSLAALFGLTASAAFTFAGTVWAATRETVRGGPVGVGLLAVALLVVLGNLAGGREWLRADGPPLGYDWFAPSRVIKDTINEFPAFSFTLGDVHAHVLALPFTLLALAFALQVALTGPRADAALRAVAEALAAALALGALYAINSWSYPLAAGVLVLAVLVWLQDPAAAGRRGFPLVWLGLVLIGSVVLLLPFWLNFDPPSHGIGGVKDHPPFTTWAGDMALIYGALAWLVAAAYASRVLAAPRPARLAIWLAVGAAFVLSLLAPLHYSQIAALAAAAGVALHAALRSRLPPAERFVWVLIAVAAGCLLVPELVYVRDEFDGTVNYRSNTVFKLGYHAYLLLAIAAACAVPWAGRWLPRRMWTGWAAVAAVLLLLGLVYPYAGPYAKTRGYSASPTLDGLGWLRARAPGDVGAIEWLRAHTPGDAVVLESAGPDYSVFGHARISTFSGRPTVMGWAGHEIQWAHDPGTRLDDVRRMYAATTAEEARPLLARYGVRYVVVGPLERTDYPDSGLAKWDQLGRRVYDRDGTTVWELR
jgi:YYY domain-containing protein